MKRDLKSRAMGLLMLTLSVVGVMMVKEGVNLLREIVLACLF